MSGQRVRRNVSPASTKQGPMKAVLAFSLKQGSPTRSSNASPTPNSHKIWARKSPDNRVSPERKSPGSPSLKEKTKSHRQSPSLWRTNSLDAIYLTGQWPKDFNTYQHYQSTQDKSTQTPEEWDTSSNDRRKEKGHKRSASFGQGDQLKLFKQRLQRTKEGSKQNESYKQRQSPVQGKHSAVSPLSLTAPPTVFSQQSKAIGIPNTHIPKPSMSRFQRNSVEGLNTEIEKLVLKTISGSEMEESDNVKQPQEIPDGHRAPVPEVVRLINPTRSVDTQTPSGHLDEPRTSSTGSRSDSISPAIPIILGQMDTSRPSSRSESADSKSDKGEIDTTQDSPISSPKPESSCDFVREPPDGCEKVKVIEESRKPSIKESLFGTVKPNQFVFKPSQSSAFCRLYKSYYPSDLTTIRTTPVPTSQPTSIEGQ